MSIIVNAITLAIDLSAANGSLAVEHEGHRFESALPGQMNHSEELLSGLVKLLQDHSLRLRDIKTILITKGPGSFTGLRIAYATAKALAASLGAEIISLSTSECRWLAFGQPAKVVTGISRDKYLVEDWTGAHDAKTLTLDEWKRESAMTDRVFLIDANTAKVTFTSPGTSPGAETPHLVEWPCQASYLLAARGKARSEEKFSTPSEQHLCSPEYYGTTRFKMIEP